MPKTKRGVALPVESKHFQILPKFDESGLQRVVVVALSSTTSLLYFQNNGPPTLDGPLSPKLQKFIF